MVREFKLVLVSLIALFPLACGSVISKEIRKEAKESPGFVQVSQNPNAFKGQTVIWGGEIVNVETQTDGSTLIEVFERPLKLRDAPDLDERSDGRFLIRVDKFLDPYIYKSGKKITVGGVVVGEEVKPIGRMEYRYPIILSKEIHLWKESYYYDPYYYDPWWGYPRIGVGFGFSYYSPVYRMNRHDYYRRNDGRIRLQDKVPRAGEL